MAYDAIRERIVLFGGFNGAPLGDTWEWDGSDWTPRFPANRPPPLLDHAMVYDRARGRVMLTAGATNTTTVHGSSWAWDGSDWMLLPGSIPGRFSHAMAYDEGLDQTVLFGGADWLAQIYGDTWVWDGLRWTQQTLAGPSPRHDHSMVYDRRRKRVVLFGGSGGGPYHQDTWEWDGSRWRQIVLPSPPPPRAAHGMVFDPARGRIVVFSGGVPRGGFHRDTWELTEVTWMQRQVSQSPAGRAYPAMAYDEARRRVVLFGGWNATVGYFGDTWEYAPVNPAQYDPFGQGCTGTAGTPTLAPAPNSYPWINDTFEVELWNLPPNQPALLNLGFSNTVWGPLTLPASLAAIGMPGCDLLVGPDVSTSLANVAGTARWSLPLPNSSGLVGRTFYNQGLILDPAANPLGAILSNGGAGVVGAK